MFHLYQLNSNISLNIKGNIMNVCLVSCFILLDIFQCMQAPGGHMCDNTGTTEMIKTFCF